MSDAAAVAATVLMDDGHEGRGELLAAGETDVAPACRVEPVTGRPALMFLDWARLNVDAFR
jgi:hypothetical protein